VKVNAKYVTLTVEQVSFNFSFLYDPISATKSWRVEYGRSERDKNLTTNFFRRWLTTLKSEERHPTFQLLAITVGLIRDFSSTLTSISKVSWMLLPIYHIMVRGHKLARPSKFPPSTTFR